MKVFQSSDLPKPKSILMATAEANNISAQVTAYDKYSREMELVSSEVGGALGQEMMVGGQEVIMEALGQEVGGALGQEIVGGA